MFKVYFHVAKLEMRPYQTLKLGSVDRRYHWISSTDFPRHVHKFLQLLYEDECQDGIRSVGQKLASAVSILPRNSRQSEPGRSPASHKESWPFISEGLGYDFSHTLSKMSANFASSSKLLLTGRTPSTVTAFWTRLFRTSAGAHAVVATVPAKNEARKWVSIPSCRPSDGFASSSRFAAE